VIAQADDALVQYFSRFLDNDISGHEPWRLRTLDRRLSPYMLERWTRTPEDRERSMIAVGVYLGRVIVSNLGGRWHVPTLLQLLNVRLARDASRLLKYIYVVVGHQRVDVFHAAGEMIDKTPTAFSLYAFYAEIARRAGVSA
jgi:hypothetical protein